MPQVLSVNEVDLLAFFETEPKPLDHDVSWVCNATYIHDIRCQKPAISITHRSRNPA